MTDEEKRLLEGWGWPALARKAHYFRLGRSLCGSWVFLGKLDRGNDKSPDNCPTCKRRLAKERSPRTPEATSLCTSPTFPLEIGNPYPYSLSDGHFKGTRAHHMKSKHLGLPEPTAKDFEVLCALLGISERQAGEFALGQWIQRNRNQVSLETWTEARSSVAPVNRALMNVQLTVVKAELREILDALQVIKPEHELEILRKLQKMIPTAQALVEETGDKELKEILLSAVTKVTTEAKLG